MNEAHMHLMVNHLPVVLPIVSILLMLFGFVLKSEPFKRAAYLIFIFGAFTTLSAMITGEGAEEIIENIDRNTPLYIHNHEETAEVFALLSYVLGVLSFIGIWGSYRGKNWSKTFSIITLLFSLVVVFFASETATSGGRIQHTEIRNGHPDAQIGIQDAKRDNQN